MKATKTISFENAEIIEDNCLCLHVQRASRTMGRRYDEAFRSLEINNWQFSLLMMTIRPSPLTVGELAEEMAMDRATVSCNLKPLERRGLLELAADPKDARVRRVILTKAGNALLAKAVKYWQEVNERAVSEIGGGNVNSLRTALNALAFME